LADRRISEGLMAWRSMDLRRRAYGFCNVSSSHLRKYLFNLNFQNRYSENALTKYPVFGEYSYLKIIFLRNTILTQKSDSFCFSFFKIRVRLLRTMLLKNLTFKNHVSRCFKNCHFFSWKNTLFDKCARFFRLSSIMMLESLTFKNRNTQKFSFLRRQGHYEEKTGR
jgi:hypothetical protein